MINCIILYFMEWAPIRRLTLEQARKHTVFIRWLRLWLVSASALAAGLVILQIFFSSTITNPVTAEVLAPEDAVHMRNPRFTGYDNQGNTYIITASSARRRLDQDGLIDIQNPDIKNSVGNRIRALRGLFDEDLLTLELFDSVELIDSAGNAFKTDHAEIFISENRIVGLMPLKGSGPIGSIQADMFEIIDGKELILSGNIRTVKQ